MRNYFYLLTFLLFTFSSCDNNAREADKHFQAGEQRIIEKDFSGAETEFSKAIALDPNRYTPYHGRAEARIMLGKTQEAKSDIKTAMELMEKNHDINDPRYKSVYEYLQNRYSNL